MSEISIASGAGRYEIRLKGHLDSRWATWFDELSLRTEADGTTVIQGPVADQTALHGLLRKVRDVGLPLISVTRIDSEQAPAVAPIGQVLPPLNPDETSIQLRRTTWRQPHQP